MINIFFNDLNNLISKIYIIDDIKLITFYFMNEFFHIFHMKTKS